jgi:hypothetical protein
MSEDLSIAGRAGIIIASIVALFLSFVVGDSAGYNRHECGFMVDRPDASAGQATAVSVMYPTSLRELSREEAEAEFAPHGVNARKSCDAFCKGSVAMFEEHNAGGLGEWNFECRCHYGEQKP